MAIKKTPETDVNSNIEEDTAAAATLHPGAGSSGTESKSAMLATFLQLAAQLGKEDLSDLFNRTLEQIGHEADSVPGDADANRATLLAKPSAAAGGTAGALPPMPMAGVQEDIAELFGDDALSEDFRERATVIFEAALNTRSTLEMTRLAEEFETIKEELEAEYAEKLEEAVAESVTSLTEKLDQYLGYVVENWMSENQVAIENSLRAEIAEDFIEGLRNLFAESYIEVPQERLDIAAELRSELENVKEELNKTLDKNIELETLVNESMRESIIDQVSEGLAATQVEKLRSLAEGVEYSDFDTFRNKLTVIKEHFTAKSSSTSTGLITETIDGTDEPITDTAPKVSNSMKAYLDAISKSAK